jgi:hypothetical protein
MVARYDDPATRSYTANLFDKANDFLDRVFAGFKNLAFSGRVVPRSVNVVVINVNDLLIFNEFL